jgi:nudix-type nucleoside diphosphatase (YffH/AdpP family)
MSTFSRGGIPMTASSRWRRSSRGSRRFDGDAQRDVRRAVFRVTDAATVLPYDPVRDRILLLEQLRFGPLAQGDPAPWLLEPVAGLIDAGETPEETARREAAEEAGLVIGDLHFVARYYPSPGGVSQVLYSYIGLADLPDEAGAARRPRGRGGGHPRPCGRLRDGDGPAGGRAIW